MKNKHILVILAIVVPACALSACCGFGMIGLIWFNPKQSTVSEPNSSQLDSSFQTFVKSCEQSRAEIENAYAANPIRGAEKEANELEHYKTALLGKTVHWKMKIQAIHPPDVYLVGDIWLPTREGGSRRAVIVSFKPPDEGDSFFPHHFVISNISSQKIRDCSVGDEADVVGKVAVVRGGKGGYVITLEGARIE